MILKEIHIENFGKLKKADFHFGPRINLIYGENEAGKSTLHAFLKGMLFGLERGRGRASRSDEYTRYFPWNQEGEYGGWLRFEKEGRLYLLHRSFQLPGQSMELTDETARKSLGTGKEALAPFLEGLSPSLYENTISIGQLKSATGQSLADALKNHAGNINQTGSSGLDLKKASSTIKERRKKLTQSLFPVTREQKDRLEEKLSLWETKEADFQKERNRLEEKQEAIKNRLKEEEKEYHRLEQILKRSRTVLEESSFSGKEEVLAYEKRLENAYSTWEHHLPCVKGMISRHRLFSVFSEISYYGMLLLFLFAGISFFRRFWLPFALSLAGAVFLYFASSYLSVKKNNWNTFCQARDFLKEAFRFCPEDPRTAREQFEEIQKRLSLLAQLFERTAKMEKQLSQLTASVFQYQKELSAEREQFLSISQNLMEQKQKEKERDQAYVSLQIMEYQLSENEKIQEEIRACDKALETFQTISDTLQETLGGPLEKEAAHILKHLTRGKYSSLIYDQKGDLSVFQGLRKIPLEQVSRGAAEQIYLALRLAAVWIFWPDRNMPLLFDDSFALYDDKRLEAALSYLSGHYPGQILIFSCQKREIEICEMLKLPYTLISL